MAEVTARTVLLLRHGKSEWPVGVPDAERPLGPRGRNDGMRVGAVAARRGYVPDYVVTSPTRRTRETWPSFRDGLSEVLGASPTNGPVSTDARIYHNSVDDLLAVVRETPEECECLLLVGHNPSTQALAESFDADQADAFAERLGDNYPTATLAVFTLTESWQRARVGSARWRDLIVPRDLRPGGSGAA